ncbi:Hypothetical protein A7982_10314 [Minicystis rosea]|nr:Hypothetical protein A7982_10314 [Minicystis rosea]
MTRGRKATRTPPPEEANTAPPPRPDGLMRSTLARDPIVARVFTEQSLGYACLSPSGHLVESNPRAHELAARYHTSPTSSDVLVDLARRAVARGPDRAGFRLSAPDEDATLVIHVHRLDREIHHLRDDVLLVVLREWAAAQPTAAPSALTARQLQIAKLLTRRGLSYKEIAAALDVSEGTVRKHAEHIYRVLGIHSRAELARLLG